MRKFVLFFACLFLVILFNGCFPDTEFKGKISGTNGGAVSAGKLDIFVPNGISQNDIEYSIVEKKDMPELINSPQQKELLDGARLAGPVYSITTSTESFNKPLIVNLSIDKKVINDIKPDEDLFIYIVRNGKMELQKITIADLDKGYVTFETTHFCDIISVIGKMTPAIRIFGYPFLIWSGVNLYYATKMATNELKAWEFVEPKHPDIVKFINDNNLKLPENVGVQDEFTMVNYNKKFEIKDYQYIHPWDFTGMKGSEVLKSGSVTCWDVSNLFGSILYSFDNPDLSNKIKMVNGYIDGTRHSWVEVVIDGKVFVVDTYHGASEFRFVERDSYYKKYNLQASYMFTKDPNSYQKYDANWCASMLYQSNNDEARMAWLKDRHKELQEQLNNLAAKGENLTDAEVKMMDQIRAEQKKIYDEYMALKQKTQNK